MGGEHASEVRVDAVEEQGRPRSGFLKYTASTGSELIQRRKQLARSPARSPCVTEAHKLSPIRGRIDAEVIN